ncbi:NAD-dependent epimerase/dehydratase family protein [Saccharopolyspora spinosa]|uniref:NAD-dependent epimerase/dehydratase family protein n=1 Tax=Saccharopolyspora spinosa TaxID=60894 RepID=UPI000237B40F|nr:NAD(P)-dependent oxidoreductase [Saccharopolyspora spinosa]
MRECGSRNLVEAAVEVGARRIIGQSMTAAYRPHGHDVLDEESPLWTDAPGCWGDAVRALAAMEEAVLTCPDIEGVALRYGALYGPNTHYAPGGAIHARVCGSALPLVDDGVGLTSFTHVDDAAGAVLALVTGGEPGIYNVVDNEPAESMEWLPAYARMAGGPAPVSLTVDQARAQLDWLTVHQLTEQRGATNFRLRETLGWRPMWPSWREGFAALFGLWPG